MKTFLCKLRLSHVNQTYHLHFMTERGAFCIESLHLYPTLNQICSYSEKWHYLRKRLFIFSFVRKSAFSKIILSSKQFQ